MVSLVTRMRRTQPSAIRSLRVLFWLACIAALAGALGTFVTPTIETNGGDKLLHAGVFYLLALLGVLGYPKAAPAIVGLGLVVFGGAIELLQAIPALHRDPDIADLVADAIGVTVAIFPLSVARARDGLAALRR